MSRLVMMLALVLFTAGMQAQIFPRIEKDEVKKRIATGGAQPEEKPEPEPTVGWCAPHVASVRRLARSFRAPGGRTAMSNSILDVRSTIR